MGGSTPVVPGRVFMSYRRDDTDFPAAWLYERLTSHLGREQVFKDVDSIELGDDFVAMITSAVGSCDVLLALIGDRWLEMTNDTGQRRLDDPHDFVRLELEAALKRKVRVIPILLGSASMPTADQLPASLSKLTRRQALQLTTARFEADIGRLLRVLDRTLAEQQAQRDAKDRAQREAEAKSQREAEASAAREAEAKAAREAEAKAARDAEAAREAEAVAAREAEARAARDAEAKARREAEARRKAATVPVAPAPTPEPADAGGAQAPGPGGNRRLLVVGSLVALVVAVVGALVLQPWAPKAPDQSASQPPGTATSAPPAPSTTQSAPAPSRDGPDILAHRGGSEEYSQETQQAMTAAARKGYAVEADLRWTRDNQAVFVRDEAATIALECDGSFNVSQTDWETLNSNCKSDPSPSDNKRYPIATYKEAMAALAAIPDSWLYLELKVDQTASQNREIVDVIRANGLSSHTVVTSTQPQRLAAIEAIAPDLRTMQFIHTAQAPVASLSKRLWAVAVAMEILSRSYVRELKRAGLVVIAFTPNEEATWETAQASGVDKVVTDRPKVYSDWVAKND
jgi:glycerophosphoryl diester phosphodiesterase